MEDGGTHYLSQGVAEVEVVSAEEHLDRLGLLVNVIVGEGRQQLQQTQLNLGSKEVVMR